LAAGASALDLREFTEKYVVRAKALQAAPGAPPDARLPRFKRDRFMVLGRKSERRAGDVGPVLNTGINLAYLRCEPGKGFCSHKHPDWEIFVVLSGRWKVTVAGETEFVVNPLDVVAVPGDVFHDALNVGEGAGYMMSINRGTDTAGYALHPSILEELGLRAPSPLQEKP
jgi:mannose-6-phosphate isomerase-like protein (cupin superfamily)